MKHHSAAACLLAAGLCLFSCGCSPALLERDYRTTTPHTSRYWESEAVNTLRAENYQEIVNDILLLTTRHTESAVLRLYNYHNDWQVTNAVEKAIVEVRQETPVGAYAIDYITASSQSQRGYYEISLEFGYRRTAEQIQAIRNASSPSAVYSLLNTMLAQNQDELAVSFGYWNADGKDTIRAAVAQVRQERGLEQEEAWGVYYYPAENIGLVEILRHPEEPYIDPDLPAEEESAEAGEIPEDPDAAAAPSEEGEPAETDAETAVPKEQDEAISAG